MARSRRAALSAVGVTRFSRVGAVFAQAIHSRIARRADFGNASKFARAAGTESRAAARSAGTASRSVLPEVHENPRRRLVICVEPVPPRGSRLEVLAWRIVGEGHGEIVSPITHADADAADPRVGNNTEGGMSPSQFNGETY